VSDDIHALSGAYAVDALDEVERARFERHLAHCSACQTEVDSLVAAASELSVLTEATPPDSLRAKVLGQIATVRPLPPIAEPGAPAVEDAPSTVNGEPAQAPVTAGPTTDGVAEVAAQDTSSATRVERLADRRRGPGRGWRVLVAAATVAILSSGGFIVWRQANTDPSQAIADRVLAAGDATRTSKRFPDGSTATIVRSGSLRTAVIVTTGMPQAPSGKVYQLWLQDPTGHMASAGLMPPGPDQVVVLEGDASKATGAGITIEPTGGSGQPTSDPIVLFTFA
jgi:anti-sigma-K factor RskA